MNGDVSAKPKEQPKQHGEKGSGRPNPNHEKASGRTDQPKQAQMEKSAGRQDGRQVDKTPGGAATADKQTSAKLDLTKDGAKAQSPAKLDLTKDGVKAQSPARLDLTKDAIKTQTPAKLDLTKDAVKAQSRDKLDLTKDAVKAASRPNPNREATAGSRPKDKELSVREQTERRTVHTPRDYSGEKPIGVPFGFGKDKPVEGSTQKWLDSQSYGDKKALLNPNTVLRAEVSASRPGTDAANQNLTDRRGANLTKELRDLGVNAQIEIVSKGESDAKAAHKPDKQDDAGDRVATFTIKRGAEQPPEQGDGGRAVKSVMESWLRPPSDRNAQEVGHMAVDSVKKGLQKTLTTGDPVGGLIEAAKEFGKQGAKWSGEKLTQDMREKNILDKLAANYARGVTDGLATAAGEKPRGDTSRNWAANNNSVFYKQALRHGTELAERMRAAEWKNVATVIRNPDLRREFEKTVQLRMTSEVQSRRSSHLPAQHVEDGR